jgi:hypothetical protein
MNHSRLDDYLDHSDDLVARVRRAKEAAQRRMEEFGDPAEYEITIIRGRKKEPTEPAEKSGLPVAQPSSQNPTATPQPASQIRSDTERQTTLEFIGDVREPQAPAEEK